MRFIPLHVLVNSVGQSMCDILPAVHALTGCDITSKFGTKSAALKTDPTKFLIVLPRWVMLNAWMQRSIHSRCWVVAIIALKHWMIWDSRCTTSGRLLPSLTCLQKVMLQRDISLGPFMLHISKWTVWKTSLWILCSTPFKFKRVILSPKNFIGPYLTTWKWIADVWNVQLHDTHAGRMA